MVAQLATVLPGLALGLYTNSSPQPFALGLFHGQFLMKLVGGKFLRQSRGSSSSVEAYQYESEGAIRILTVIDAIKLGLCEKAKIGFRCLGTAVEEARKPRFYDVLCISYVPIIEGLARWPSSSVIWPHRT